MQSKAKVLRELFKSKPIIRIAGAHNGLGAKLIERNRFDGIWASGLEISTSFGVPDANILTMTENLEVASAVHQATVLPVVCDCDTGFGNASNVIHMVKKYEAAGLAAVVIEDKQFPKVNSFIPGRQELAPVEEFMGKIEAAKNAQSAPDFMVFARVEALIAGWGMDEALRRAYAYAEAGADGIVIHSKASTPDEIFTFAKKWTAGIPLVAIPTTYSAVTADELAARGFKMVIYANHGLRASIRAMDEVLKSIHETGSTAAVEDKIASMKEVFHIQGMANIKEEEKRFDKKEAAQAVILAAGQHRLESGLNELLSERPLCMLEIGGKTLAEHQADILRSCGVKDICVVGGYRADKIQLDGAAVIRNPDFASTGIAHSLMAARDFFKNRCVVVYSDIIFDRKIPEQLLTSPYPITLVIDRAYQTLPFREKKLDLAVVEDSVKEVNGRSLRLNTLKRVRKVGRRIDKKEAAHEFIGMAFFQKEGLKRLNEAWAEALEKFEGKSFYEAPSVEKADFNDLIQYLIDSGNEVYGMEIEHGWSEIHSLEDYERVSAHFNKTEKVLSAGK